MAKQGTHPSHGKPPLPDDFDREIDRSGTGSLKWNYIDRDGRRTRWDRTEKRHGDRRVLPMWVADMDFQSPRPVIEALVARAEHGIYGYTAPTESYEAAVVDWMARRHDWTVRPEWIRTTPGVVPAMNLLVRTFVPAGGKVIVQTPAYYPFYGAVTNNGGQILGNRLKLVNGRYEMDFADLAARAADPQVAMIILCSPHNPVGRVWTAAELQHFAQICTRHDVVVVSDEIHGDLVFRGHAFTPLLKAAPQLADRTVVCTAPSKTFNLAGLQTSNILIPDRQRRKAFARTLKATGLGGANPFGAAALEAAYGHGGPWLDGLLDYIEANLDFMAAFIDRHLPEVTLIRPEGTYLAWLDCRRLGLDNKGLQELMLDRAGVYLDEGYIFGPGGDGFERINLACPRKILADALERIRKAIADR